jgi:Fusaric acid resistance protein-like
VLFSWKPNHLALITIIVLAQMATEVFIRRQYGVALVFLSPLAIGMSNLSRDLPWPPLLIDRVTEASLGASVAFVVILLDRWLLTKVAERGVAGAVADFW